MTEQTPPQMPAQKPSHWASYISVGWVCLVIGFFAYYQYAFNAPMNLAEIGAYFAGTLTPLALFWMVAGYFQQGKQLRASNESLSTQITQFSDSLKIQTQQAVTSETTSRASQRAAFLKFYEHATGDMLTLINTIITHIGKYPVGYAEAPNEVKANYLLEKLLEQENKNKKTFANPANGYLHARIHEYLMLHQLLQDELKSVANNRPLRDFVEFSTYGKIAQVLEEVYLPVIPEDSNTEVLPMKARA